MTLATTAPEIYRALIEATAFGTRVIVDAFSAAGIEIADIVACGGLPQHNKLLSQIYADVTGLNIRLPARHRLRLLVRQCSRRLPLVRAWWIRLDYRCLPANGTSRTRALSAGGLPPCRV